MEARLFHQYMTSTYHTLAQDGLSANHLSVNIPRLATSFVYLLDGIHALSALHLASIETDNRVSWLDAALRYQSQACSGLGKVLADITTREYEPAFVTSIFIMLFAMGYRVISVDTKPPDPLSLVREIRTLISGPAMLFDKIVKGGFTAKLEHWMHVPDTKESLPDVTNTKYGPCTSRGPWRDINAWQYRHVRGHEYLISSSRVCNQSRSRRRGSKANSQ